MPKIANETLFAFARTLPHNHEDTIACATQTADAPLARAALKYLRTVYSMAHPKPARHEDETRAMIIQLDEMGILDTM